MVNYTKHERIRKCLFFLDELNIHEDEEINYVLKKGHSSSNMNHTAPNFSYINLSSMAWNSSISDDPRKKIVACNCKPIVQIFHIIIYTYIVVFSTMLPINKFSYHYSESSCICIHSSDGLFEVCIYLSVAIPDDASPSVYGIMTVTFLSFQTLTSSGTF